MPLKELLARVDELQVRIVAAGPLSPEAKRKLDYRFRLDWNYHSNVMEGSSLTKQETRTIMLGNVTVEGKPIKDVLEMKGHDDVVVKLLQMTSGELQLSEARIKEVHKAIVKEDDPNRQSWPGHWKKDPNYLLNYRGERVDFTPPDQVAEAMHELLDRTKAAIERIERKAKDAPHPVVLGFDFHREYVTIHPFHDGNGRTARIFSNLLLMRFGYPPVIIKVDEKEAYNRFLAEVQVYGASPDLFNEFMTELLIRSQELALDAIEGRDLADSDELTKRANLLFVQAEGKRLSEEEKAEDQKRRIEGWITSNGRDLALRIAKRFEVFSKFYSSTAFKYLIQKKKGVAEPFIDKTSPSELVALWNQTGDHKQIGINLHFIGFKFGSKPLENKIIAAIRVQPDNVHIHWYGPKTDDIIGYVEDVNVAPMPIMERAANEFLKTIESGINT